VGSCAHCLNVYLSCLVFFLRLGSYPLRHLNEFILIPLLFSDLALSLLSFLSILIPSAARPFNYPLNEMYAMLIPALLMGNTVVVKLPNIGGLAHVLSAPAFAAALPPGVVNFLTGSGRKTCTPVMASGKVDMLGFIGGSKAADALIGAHPKPHRLKVFSQLEGKNMGIVLKDADLTVAAAQCKDGATSYNGQRCTAIKLIVVRACTLTYLRATSDNFLIKGINVCAV